MCSCWRTAFLGRLSRRSGRQIALARSAADVLVHYTFPGNVRELQSILESAASLSLDDPQTITEKDLGPLPRESAAVALAGGLGGQPLSLDSLERAAIEQAVRFCHGNRTRAASLLGISRDTLHRKLRQFRQGG